MNGAQPQSIENIIDEIDLSERGFWFEDVAWLERKYKLPGNSPLGAWVDWTEATEWTITTASCRPGVDWNC
jgi:hypothetical protein